MSKWCRLSRLSRGEQVEQVGPVGPVGQVGRLSRLSRLSRFSGWSRLWHCGCWAAREPDTLKANTLRGFRAGVPALERARSPEALVLIVG